MNKAEELNKKILTCLETYNLDKVDKYFNMLATGDNRDESYYREIYGIQNGFPCQMYSYLACAVKILKPNIIVELGADKGVSALMMWSELSPDGKLYSIDDKPAWKYIPSSISNIIKITGDSINPVLPTMTNLSKVRLWFIDAEHTNERVKGEYEYYKKYWKDGTVIFFDDIDLYKNTWDSIGYHKYESRTIHNQNFGVVVI